MIDKNNMKITNVYKNDINGGSLSLFIAHKDSNYKINGKNIKKLFSEEKKFKLNKKKTY